MKNTAAIQCAVVAAAALSAPGCITDNSSGRGVVDTADHSAPSRAAAAGGGIKNFFRRQAGGRTSPRGTNNESYVWDWATAIPRGGLRGEIVSTEIPGPVLARLMSDDKQGPIVLASATNRQMPDLPLTDVNGVRVRNYSELHAAADRVFEEAEPVEVEIARGTDDSAAARVEPKQLLMLLHSATPDDGPVRVNENGNPWIVVREDGVRCKLMARVERTRGLLHLAVSLANCWGDDKLLPVDVRAQCDGQPLACQSVDQVLERLYGPASGRDNGVPHSFAEVSESEDFLMPTRFRELNEQVGQATRFSMAPPLPAMISIPGEIYPGPAVLGDARALSAFLLQRQMLVPGELERLGWVMFAGDELKDGGVIDVEIDLGNGPRRFQFTAPSR